MPSPRPLALTDDQLATIRRYAEPLHPHDRSRYLQRVVALLDGREIGDGLIARAARAAQLEFRRAPAEADGRPHVGKYAR
jgi:hypothetical protein